MAEPRLKIVRRRRRAEPKRIRITLASIRRLPPGTYWDATMPGFGIIVREPKADGSLNASFVAMRVVNGKTAKITVGRLGRWTVEEARKEARRLLVAMDQGVDPRAEKRARRARSLTLGEALEMHLEDMRAKGRAPRSIEMFEKEPRKYLADWLPRPLVEITGVDCRRKHRKLTEDHGPFMANRAIRHLRAAWNTAARINPDVPDGSPTRAVAYHRERRRDDPIPWAELPKWWKAVHDIRSPVRRDLQLFYLFTGLRRNDGKSVRWEHVDLDAGTIHRPTPKGGADKAFTVPVSGFVLELLRRRREGNATLFPGGDGGWVFPSRNRRGEVTCVAEAKEQRYDQDGKKVASPLPTPHRLRHTFATAGHESYLRELDLKILMNHSRPRGDVTQGYVHPSLGHLREAVEKVATFLLQKAGAAGGRKREVG